jgi:hypothetical protein
MTSSRQRAVHAYHLGGPLCSTVVGCNALYAVDDQGRDRPEQVTCKRCLWLLGVRPGPAEHIADLIGSANDWLRSALRHTPGAELTEAERADLGERLGRTRQLTDNLITALADQDTSAISDYLREQADGEG